MNTLRHFKDFLKLASCFRSRWNWEVYFKFLYFPWWFYTNIKKQTLRQTRLPHMSAHVMARLAPFIFTVFYCNVWRTDRFDNLTVKEFNLHWCNSNFRKPAEKKKFSISSSNSWSPVRNIDIPLLSTFHSNSVCDIAVCCCKVFSGSIYRPDFSTWLNVNCFFSVSQIYFGHKVNYLLSGVEWSVWIEFDLRI